MTYARQHNDRIQVGLPRTGKLSDGRTVSNYRNLSKAILTSEGWVPYINIRPEVGTYVLTFFTTDAGSTWYGMEVGEFVN